MELAYSSAEEAFRTEARTWLRANVPQDLPPSGSKDGFAAHIAWERTLHAAGWSAVAWPRALGGRDASIVEWLIFEEEYYLAGAPPRVTQNGISCSRRRCSSSAPRNKSSASCRRWPRPRCCGHKVGRSPALDPIWRR
jgi:hypothetical protein